MPAEPESHVSRYFHCDVRCQLVFHTQQVVHMFDTVLHSITRLDDGDVLVTYDGGAIHIVDGEIVPHPNMLILQGRHLDWSLVVTRWADMPGDIQPFPRASRQ